LAALALLPAASAAGWFGLRNDTGGVLIIRRATVINNVSCPGRPLLLYPGETIWDGVVQPCAKLIAVYSPHQLQRPLLESQIRCGNDQLYSVQVTSPGQVQLVPAHPVVAQARRISR
jgi:hypothetical protein